MVAIWQAPYGSPDIVKRWATLWGCHGQPIIKLVGFNHLEKNEKYDLVSWGDDIPNIWKNKIHVPNHQQLSRIP